MFVFCVFDVFVLAVSVCMCYLSDVCTDYVLWVCGVLMPSGVCGWSVGFLDAQCVRACGCV